MTGAQENLPPRLIDGDADSAAATLLRKFDRQASPLPPEAAVWDRTLSRLARRVVRHRLWLGLAAACGILAGAVGVRVLWTVRGGSRSVVASGAVADVAANGDEARTVPVPSVPEKAPPLSGGPVVPEPASEIRTAAPSVKIPQSPRIELGGAVVGLPFGRSELVGEAEVVLSPTGKAGAFADARAAIVALAAGAIDLHVEKRDGRTNRKFEVVAGAYRFTVLGTRFRVTRVGRMLKLAVTEGRVAVSRWEQLVAVIGAGENWSSSTGETASRPANGDPIPVETEKPPGSSTVGGSTVGGSTVGGSTVGGSTVGGSTFSGSTVGGSTVGGSTVNGSTFSGSTVGGSTVGGSTVNGSTFSGSTVGGSTVGGSTVGGSIAASPPAGTPPPFIALATPSGPLTPPPLPTSSARLAPSPSMPTAPDARSLEVARVPPIPLTRSLSPATARVTPTNCALRAHADARRGLECYLLEARGDGLAAEVALYETARLRRDTLKDPAGALESLREHRRRFPAGDLKPEVDLSIAELLPSLGRYHEALTDIEALLKSPPNPERRGELLLLRGHVLREGLHDWPRAERAYAGAVEFGGTNGRAADAASFWRAVCLESMGRRDEARRAYKTYMARPRPLRAAEAARRLNQLVP